ncbi:mitochondrial ATPase expression-domain-containing protein [Pseudoneurospora amorphoporcata]|uniref:Mitochondrial ATPase expression-domain-containing protein n=1 Tax=Pseudoneurospora amorphoporcata TaxID=241081 RepID=A0AAN6SGK3_9PEZI|nr:mitochondrial ATPase expression-domain-containing protein [Pseudoneurospora amorphoporcata]
MAPLLSCRGAVRVPPTTAVKLQTRKLSHSTISAIPYPGDFVHQQLQEQGQPLQQDELLLLRTLLARPVAKKPPPPKRAPWIDGFTGAFRQPHKMLSYFRENKLEILQLPPTAFSELLRSVDPLDAIRKDQDPLGDIWVDPVMADWSPLGALVNNYGIRKRNTDLYPLVHEAAFRRFHNGSPLLLSDYKVLLRYAGSISDPVLARKIWFHMNVSEKMWERQTDLYAEFLKARFLTEPLYTQNNRHDFRVKPVNLFPEKRFLPYFTADNLSQLRQMNFDETNKRMDRFGQNPDAEHKVEYLMRMLRRSSPVDLVFGAARNRVHLLSEEFICAALIAYARTGVMEDVQSVLWFNYKIDVTGSIETGDLSITGGRRDFYPGSPMAPTVRLLQTIATCYGSNGMIAMACKMLDHVSATYRLPIPSSVWFELLEWAYIHTSPRAAKEWKMVSIPGRRLHRNAVQLIWDTMTSPPYNAVPGFPQYKIYVEWLIKNNKTERAIQIMLDLEPLYRKQVDELQALYPLHAFNQAAFAPHSPTHDTLLWDKTLVRKDYMVHTFARWLSLVFKRIKSPVHLPPGGSSSKPPKIFPSHDISTRLIPQLIHAFQGLLPDTIHYEIPTGVIRFKRGVDAPQGFRAEKRWTEVKKGAVVSMDLRPETARGFNRLREHSLDLLKGEELQRAAGETVETLRARAVDRKGVEELVEEILQLGMDERGRGVREGVGMDPGVRRRGRRVDEEVKRMERKRAEKVLRLLT